MAHIHGLHNCTKLGGVDVCRLIILTKKIENLVKHMLFWLFVPRLRRNFGISEADVVPQY